jgi:hypothetical protein
MSWVGSGPSIIQFKCVGSITSIGIKIKINNLKWHFRYAIIWAYSECILNTINLYLYFNGLLLCYPCYHCFYFH